jgi:ABC-type uncharacterized transport system involved in gliding motility auxiliary subunit
MQIAVIAILGLLSLAIGLILMLILPGIQFIAWGLLALGVIFLAVAFIFEFRRVRGALVSRRGKFGASTTIMVSIFIGIILLANGISVGNYHRFDFTGLAQFTLTSQTKEVLANLENPVEVLCFFTPNNSYKEIAKNLLTEYSYYTDKLSVQDIDPDIYPDRARQYGVTDIAAIYGTVIFESTEGKRLVYGPQMAIEAEHAFTSAILEVTGAKQKKVYFLTGHGESSVYSDYSNAREGLLDNLFQVETLDLLSTHDIPEDCAILIIPGPTKSMTSNELEILSNYLKNNGALMVLINPDPPQEVKQLLSSWGVDVGDGIVIDPTSYAAPGMENLLITNLRNFLRLRNVYFPGATAIIPQPNYEPQQIPDTTPPEFVWVSENTQVEMYSLLRSSADSWLEKDYNPDKEPMFDEGVDLGPPINIGFLIYTKSDGESEEELTEQIQITRLIVIGDSDFASNKHFYNGNNAEFFLNSVNLLTAGTELISIDRKVLQTRGLIIGPEEARFLNISSIGLLPIIILVIGGIIWWRRR